MSNSNVDLKNNNKNVIKCYFSDFKDEKNHKNNMLLSFDKHNLNFTSINGDLFNLKLKNKICNIFPILNGIIIKIIQNNESIPFFQSEINNKEVKYRNYIITTNPYSTMMPLILNENEQFEIIKTSKKLPFLLVKEENKLKLVLILFKKNSDLVNFENNLKKMLNNNIDLYNLGNEPSNQFPNEFSFKLITIAVFDEINLENDCEIRAKIYCNFSEINSIFVSIFYKQSLIIEQIKFNKNIKLGEENFCSVEHFKFDNIIDYNLIKSLISKTNQLLFNVRKNKNNLNESNNNIICDFLNQKDIEYKTIIFLDKNNTLYFLESRYVIFNYSLNNIILFNVKQFQIKNECEYYFYGNNKNEYSQINKYFELNNKITILLLKYVKYEYGKLFYWRLLNILFSELSKDYKEKINHLDLLCDLLTTFYCQSFNIENSHYPKNKNFNFNLSNYDDYNELIEIIQKKQINTIKDLLNFSKLMFENIKIFNVYNNSYSIRIIYSFIIALLSIYNDSDTTFNYITYFYYFYELDLQNIKIFYPQNYQNLNTIKPLVFGKNIFQNHKYIFNQLYNIEKIIEGIAKNAEQIEIDESQNTNCYEDNYIIFTKKIPKIQKINSSNFLIKIIESNYDINTIKNLRNEESLLILSEISKAKNNPYLYISNIPNNIKIKILSLLDRLDLVKNIIFQPETKNPKIETLSSNLYINEVSDYDTEYYLTKIKFSEDNRIREVNRILSPTRILKINITQLNKIVDLDLLENEKFYLTYKNLIKQYTSCIGNGALNLNTIKTFPKEILPIKPLNTQCLLTGDDSNYTLDSNKEQLKDKDFANWAEFNNGVSQSLKLSTDDFNNKSYIRNWILFNKTEQPTFEHGGFLLGMGLLKQLDSLFATDVYQYMKTTHDGVTIGILLGRSASKISSMEETLSRTLCLHISFLIPSTLEITIPMIIQCSAVIGIGLIYMKSGNRLMTEMLLNQIGKVSNNNDKNIDLKHLDSYNLCLGFAIGLINLGLGKANSNYDLNYENKLISLISNSGNYIDENLDNQNVINLNRTSIAAYACLTISFLQSKNSKIASKMKIPENLYQLDSFKPFNLYLSILGKNLILWDNIYPSENWIYSNIPSFIKFLYENPLSVISEDFAYSFKINLIEFSQISTSYFYSLCAGIMSLAFKFCGSNDSQVSSIIINIIKTKLLKVNVINDIIIRDCAKYDDNNKSSLNKTTLDECLCICAYALSMIRAGSGDLETFKILRILRKKVDNINDYKYFKPGYTLAINHAIGILFLGSGGLTFNNSINSLTFLYISTFPIFNKTLNDNEKYLQPLRHFYVLACENKIFETRDVNTNKIVRSRLSLEYLNGNTNEVITPINIDNFSFIKKIYMKDIQGYYNMEINRENIDFKYWTNNSNLMKTKIAFIKRRHLLKKEISLSVSQIDVNNNQSIILIKDTIKSLQDYINENNSILNEEVKLISEIVIEQIENTFENLNVENNFDLLYMKVNLLILIHYVNTDNIISFYIVNDKLNKLKNAIGKGNCEQFQVFEFFLNFEDKSKSGNISLNLCIKEIKTFIMRGLFEKYKINIRNFCKVYFENNINNELVDWNLIKFLELNKLNLTLFCIILQFINQNFKEKDILLQLMKCQEISKNLTEDNYDFINNLVKFLTEKNN